MTIPHGEADCPWCDECDRWKKELSQYKAMCDEASSAISDLVFMVQAVEDQYLAEGRQCFVHSDECTCGKCKGERFLSKYQKLKGE